MLSFIINGKVINKMVLSQKILLIFQHEATTRHREDVGKTQRSRFLKRNRTTKSPTEISISAVQQSSGNAFVIDTDLEKVKRNGEGESILLLYSCLDHKDPESQAERNMD